MRKVNGKACGVGSPDGYGVIAYRVQVPRDLRLGEMVVVAPNGDTGEVTYINRVSGVIWLMQPDALNAWLSRERVN